MRIIGHLCRTKECSQMTRPEVCGDFGRVTGYSEVTVGIGAIALTTQLRVSRPPTDLNPGFLSQVLKQVTPSSMKTWGPGSPKIRGNPCLLAGHSPLPNETIPPRSLSPFITITCDWHRYSHLRAWMASAARPYNHPSPHRMGT